jgi:hypothetical protein
MSPAGLTRMMVVAGNFDAEVGQVATMRQLSASEYQVTISRTELALMRNALCEAERLSCFGIEVLADVDNTRDAEPSENGRLRREIEALATRIASLRLLQRTMAEVDGRGEAAPRQLADLDRLSSGAALDVARCC